DEDVTDMRGVIPQWTVQIAAQAVTHLESEKLWPWVSGAIADPRHPLNEYVYTFSDSTAAGGGEQGATGGTDACSDIGKNIFGLGAFTTLEEAVEALNQAWQSEHPGNRTYTDVPVAYS